MFRMPGCACLHSLRNPANYAVHFVAGDGWASRLEDSLLHGTIPVIIQDGVAEKFYGLVDFAAISVRIAEADIERVCHAECRHVFMNMLMNKLIHNSHEQRCCLVDEFTAVRV